jgi:hypothetical protein
MRAQPLANPTRARHEQILRARVMTTSPGARTACCESTACNRDGERADDQNSRDRERD